VAVELCSTASNRNPVSVTVDTRLIDTGDEEYVDEAWTLKERIRREEGVLKQRHGFFTDAYRRSTVYLLVDPGYDEDTIVGFAAIRRDGYVLFLAVNPGYRGEGFGRRLVAAVVEDHGTVTCHARATNDEALSFYEHLGFEVQRRVDDYYEDDGDAYYLRLGDGGIAETLSRFVPGG
jgi:ribosomal protein S18 acetylase RimI-like enzyme